MGHGSARSVGITTRAISRRLYAVGVDMFICIDREELDKIIKRAIRSKVKEPIGDIAYYDQDKIVTNVQECTIEIEEDPGI